MFGYSLNYLIDLANAIIVDVEATPTRISKEVGAAETMIERTVARFGLEPDHLPADVAYGTGAMLGWLVERGIDPHIPVWDQSEVSANGKFPRADFAYDHERDLYICPGGRELKTSGTVHDGTTIKYIASAATAPSVRSSGTAPPAWSAGSHATSISMPATMPRGSCRPRPIGSHAPHGRRSKPCLARPSISAEAGLIVRRASAPVRTYRRVSKLRAPCRICRYTSASTSNLSSSSLTRDASRNNSSILARSLAFTRSRYAFCFRAASDRGFGAHPKSSRLVGFGFAILGYSTSVDWESPLYSHDAR
jgi:hypothetical protein